MDRLALAEFNRRKWACASTGRPMKAGAIRALCSEASYLDDFGRMARACDQAGVKIVGFLRYYEEQAMLRATEFAI